MSDLDEPARERRSDARRNVEAILEAARTVLAQDPTASMATIAAGAGVHRATVHRHFPARDDLLAALHERALQECLAALVATRREADGHRDAILRSTAAILEIGDRYRVPQWRAIFTPAPDEAAARTAIGEVMIEMFAEASRSGDVRTDIPPEILVALYAGTLVSAGALIARGDGTPASLAEHILRLVSSA